MAKNSRKKQTPSRSPKTKSSSKSEDERVDLQFSFHSSAVIEFLPLGLVVALIYWLTLCPFLPGGDSGELIVVSHHLGVAHPPGYPLYTLLAHVFTHLPFGSVAWRVNLFSAVCSWAAVFLIFSTVRLWLKNLWLAYAAAGLFAFAPLIWRYSVVAEVFALNNFFLALLLYLLYRFFEAPKIKWALLFAFFTGLGLSHHHTLVLAAFPMSLVAFFYHRRLLFQPTVFASGVAVFLIGLLPYLYLPWASAKKLMISWGDLTTWEGFKAHFLRQEYGTFQLATGDETKWNVLSNFWNFLTHVPAQFLWLGFVFVIIGLGLALMGLKRGQSPFRTSLLVGLCSYVLIFSGLANMNLENRLHFDIHTRFWMVPLLFFAFFAADGLRFLWLKSSSFKQRPVFQASVVILLLLVQVGWHYRIEDQSQNDTFEEFGRALIGSLPEESIYLARGDIFVNSLRYLQVSQGFRPDVKVIPYDLLWWPWMGEVIKERLPGFVLPGHIYRYHRRRPGSFTIRELIGENIVRHSVYIGKLRQDEMQLIHGHFKLWNQGFVHKVLPIDEKPQVQVARQEAAAFDAFVPPEKSEIRDRSWEAFVFYNFWERHGTRSKEVLRRGSQNGIDLEWIKYGAEMLEKTARLKKHPSYLVYKNLGVAYKHLGQKEPAYRKKMLEAWRIYLETAPKNEPDRANIRQVVEVSR